MPLPVLVVVDVVPKDLALPTEVHIVARTGSERRTDVQSHCVQAYTATTRQLEDGREEQAFAHLPSSLGAEEAVRRACVYVGPVRLRAVAPSRKKSAWIICYATLPTEPSPT